MARRTRGRRKTRRRKRQPLIKVSPVISGIIGAAAVTNGLFNIGPVDFLTNGFLKPYMGTPARDDSNVISLYELFQLGINPGHSGISQVSGWGKASTLPGMMMYNVQQNGMQMIGGLALAAAIPKIMSKTGLNRNANKLLRATGLGGLVAF